MGPYGVPGSWDLGTRDLGSRDLWTRAREPRGGIGTRVPGSQGGPGTQGGLMDPDPGAPSPLSYSPLIRHMLYIQDRALYQIPIRTNIPIFPCIL